MMDEQLVLPSKRRRAQQDQSIERQLRNDGKKVCVYQLGATNPDTRLSDGYLNQNRSNSFAQPGGPSSAEKEHEDIGDHIMRGPESSTDLPLPMDWESLPGMNI